MPTTKLKAYKSKETTEALIYRSSPNSTASTPMILTVEDRYARRSRRVEENLSNN